MSLLIKSLSPRKIFLFTFLSLSLVNTSNSFSKPASKTYTDSLSPKIVSSLSGDSLTAFNALTVNSPTHKRALRELAPSANNSNQISTISSLNTSIGATQTRVASLRDNKESGVATGNASDAKNIWGKLIGNRTIQENIGEIDGYSANVFGLTFGADKNFGDEVVNGVAVSYARTDVSNNRSNSRSNIDNYLLTLYNGSVANQIQTTLYIF